MTASNSLFLFRFSGKRDPRRGDLLRRASGMRISLGDNFGREPGQGSIGYTVSLTLSEGDSLDTWEIEAWALDPDNYDADAVESRPRSIREVLPDLADAWHEVER